MKSMQWNTYRTRFLVKAKKLNSSLSFTDHLGRVQRGRRGDYLVESCDGVISIAPRQIFEDVYVEISPRKKSMADSGVRPDQFDSAFHCDRNLSQVGFESLQIQKIGQAGLPQRIPARQATDLQEPSGSRRKSPQPVRPGRAPSHLGSL